VRPQRVERQAAPQLQLLAEVREHAYPDGMRLPSEQQRALDQVDHREGERECQERCQAALQRRPLVGCVQLVPLERRVDVQLADGLGLGLGFG